MSYSGSYEFKNVQAIRLIEDAYRLVFDVPATMTAETLISASLSINLLLSSWANRGLNLWAVSRNNLLSLNPNQVEYQLSDNIVDILEVATRTFVRQLDGTAFSSSGVAANAFDGDPTTACTQVIANGNIGYNYGTGVTQTVTMFGLTSFNDNSYTLNVQFSVNDTTYGANEWITFFSIPTTVFKAGKVQWFNIEAPGYGQYFRILETGGADLNINEIYFNGQVSDLVIPPDSRSNYITYPNKYNVGRPVIYVFNKQIDIPSITLWPAPDVTYPCLLYNYSYQIQDIGSLSNTPFVPPNFYMALRDNLAVELALKGGPQVSENKLLILEKKAAASFDRAAQENREKYIPLKFNLDMTSYNL